MNMTDASMRADWVLETLGRESESEEARKEEANHMAILLMAFDIYLLRQKDYGSMWKSHGWRNNLEMLKSKLMRMNKAKRDSVFYDSAFDAINFSVFAALNKMAGRENNEDE